jgi:hypothetical protein
LRARKQDFENLEWTAGDQYGVGEGNGEKVCGECRGVCVRNGLLAAEELRTKMQAWCSPTEFDEFYRQAREILHGAMLFGNEGRFVREAYIASYMCKMKHAERVKLSAVDPPDFVLKINGREAGFESTEVMDPSRRRHDEYKSPERLTDFPVEKWIEGANKSGLWIGDVVQKKLAKNYPADLSLVVYLNFGEFGIRHAQVINSFADATKIAAEKFNEVWVLWKEKGYLVWKDGACQI